MPLFLSPSTQLSRARPGAADLARLAVDQLRPSLGARHDGVVLCDLLEDELRSALDGLESVRGHLEDVLRALLDPHPAPLDLLEAGEDAHAQAALAALEVTLASLARRLTRLAAGVSAGSAP
ncbi:MAG TPA: hypothetical protein VEJ89_08650 [Myxococcaceae bacterium]|jgi:hypothetical protein|nr:hypothetical protein [Myxococcaceae bacterium]